MPLMTSCDGTVPLRSAESVCESWAYQRRCASPLSTVHPLNYKGRSDECVALHYLHCRAPNMESADALRGAEHCVDLHSKILGKVRDRGIMMTSLMTSDDL